MVFFVDLVGSLKWVWGRSN